LLHEASNSFIATKNFLGIVHGQRSFPCKVFKDLIGLRIAVYRYKSLLGVIQA
jgi:hypothetical protein